MSSELSPYVALFGMNDFLFERALDGFPQSKAAERLAANTNSFRGMAAHLTMARHSLCRLLGQDVPDLGWPGLGEGYDSGFVDASDFPTLGTIVSRWRELSAMLRKGLENASAEALSAPSPIPIPGLDDAKVTDFARLNVVHESYHIGQLGLLKKALTSKSVIPLGDEAASA